MPQRAPLTPDQSVAVEALLTAARSYERVRASITLSSVRDTMLNASTSQYYINPEPVRRWDPDLAAVLVGARGSLAACVDLLDETLRGLSTDGRALIFRESPDALAEAIAGVDAGVVRCHTAGVSQRTIAGLIGRDRPWVKRALARAAAREASTPNPLPVVVESEPGAVPPSATEPEF